MVARPVDQELRGARQRLVETLRAKGIRDLAVLRAFEQTPRHLFVPSGLGHRAYDDAAMPIGSGQTISQPSIHARYLELLQLQGRERVLEVGTGSGYQTVLLSHLVEQVFSIERIPALYQQAREAIQRAGARNVSMLLGDGTLGWREYAPYDAILVSAGAPSVPEPLVAQIAEGGRMLVPVGDRESQRLFLYRRVKGTVESQEVAPVRFVPLVGHHGWEGERRDRGALEREVIAALAAAGRPLTPAEVLTDLGGQLAYTTVMTTLVRLHGKGALSRQRAGRTYTYALRGAAEQVGAALTASRMRRLLDADADRTAVLARFVADLDPADERLLSRLLGRHDGSEQGGRSP